MTSRILIVTRGRRPNTRLDQTSARVVLSYVASIVPNTPETMAHWSVERLVHAIAFAGWPGIAGRRTEVPNLLSSLALFESDDEQPPCTVKNLAFRMCCTERTTAKYLGQLEAIGLVRRLTNTPGTPDTFAVDKLALASFYARSKAPFLASAADAVPCPPARELRAKSGLSRSQWQAAHNELRDAGTITQTNTYQGWALEVLLPRRLELEALRVAGRAQSGGDAWASAL